MVHNEAERGCVKADRLLHEIADYTLATRIDSAEAWQTARYCLLADRQRIAYFFPTAHRVVFVASDRQRIAYLGVGRDSSSWRSSARSLSWLFWLRPRVDPGGHQGNLTKS
jgi:hypothetical protein